MEKSGVDTFNVFFPFSQTKYEEAKKGIAAKGKQLQQKVSWNITANMISINSVRESLFVNGCIIL